jgi:large subunit ribosomal protein L23
MELNVYDIIKRPVITSKSIELYKKLGKITFEVHKLANKINIKDAIEKIWSVKVDKVCVMNVAGKVKTFARREFTTSDHKKAIVTLKKGYKIEIPGMLETMGAAGPAEVEKEGN